MISLIDLIVNNKIPEVIHTYPFRAAWGSIVKGSSGQTIQAMSKEENVTLLLHPGIKYNVSRYE